MQKHNESSVNKSSKQIEKNVNQNSTMNNADFEKEQLEVPLQPQFQPLIKSLSLKFLIYK